MPPRGRGGGVKSDVQKCLRCSILLHESDVSKHDADCLSGAENGVNAGLVSPAAVGFGATPDSNMKVLDDSASSSLGDGGADGGATPEKSDVCAKKKKKDLSFDASNLNLSKTSSSAYGFVDADGRLHATVKSLKSSSSKLSSSELPPHPKQGRLLLIHPVTMTLARFTIGCKVAVGRDRDGVGDPCPGRFVDGQLENGRDDDDDDDVRVVCTAWPSEAVPQFSAVAADETKRDVGVAKDDGRLLVSSLRDSDLRPASLLSLTLLSSGKVKRDVLHSPAFAKFVERDIRGRCFVMVGGGARYTLDYFGLDLAFRAETSATSTPRPRRDQAEEESFAKVTLDFDKLDLDEEEEEEEEEAKAKAGDSPKTFNVLAAAAAASSTPKVGNDGDEEEEEEEDHDGDGKKRRESWFVVVVGKETKIVLSKSSSLEKDESAENVTRATYSDLGGMEEKIAEIREWIEIPLRRPEEMRRLGAPLPRGLLIYGPSGVGKTKLADAIANETRCFAAKLRSSDLWSSKSGSESESRLRDSLSSAAFNAPALILVDDVDAFCPKRKEKGGSEAERKIRGAILDAMDRPVANDNGHVMFLGTTSCIESVDPALRRPGRFDREIEIPVPTPNQRRDILKTLLRDSLHSLSDDQLKEIADRCHGYVGADLVALTQKAALAALKRHDDDAAVVESDGRTELGYEALRAAMREIQPSAMKEVAIQVPDVKWEDIGGQEELKQKLKQAVEWPLKHPEAFVRMGIVPPRGLLMYGPPGCSKTMIAKAMAKESGLNFLSVKGPELFDKYVGESERAVRELFRRARAAAPAIVFFDEIDALAASRGGATGGGVGDRVLAQMLTEMDGVQQLDGVTVIAATNRPDMVDKALLRPGRMDRVVYVPLPDAKTRSDIFRLRLSKMPVDWGSVAMEDFISKTEGFSGAEVVAVCHEAAMASLSEGIASEKICGRHFDAALRTVKPQVNKELIEFYENYPDTRDSFKIL